MFSVLFKYFNKISDDQKKCEIKERKKFDEIVDQLLANDYEETESCTTSTFRESSNIAELSWNCSRHEGIVTSLNEIFGVINGVHKFSKLKAISFWTNVKIGSKVSYLLFENSVASMKLIDAGWEEDCIKNQIIHENNLKEQYQTELRTIVGTIDTINDEVMTVDIGGTKEFIPIDKNSKWLFVEGDYIRLECVVTDDQKTWNPTTGTFGNIVEVKNIEPNSIKKEIGRVTASFEHYVIFNESIILNYSYVQCPAKLSLWEEYEYEAIETSICQNGRNMNWRITKLNKKIINGDDISAFEKFMKIQLNDEFFQLKQSPRGVIKFSTIFNKSEQNVRVLKCEITSNSGLIELQKPEKKFEIKSLNGQYRVYYTIIPQQYGSFAEQLTVDFGNFKKTSLINFQVTRGLSTKTQKLNRFGNNSELIPGQKMRTITRFIEIRIPEYLIPDQFRVNFDFKKQTQLIVYDFTLHDHGFLLEELRKENYLAKMRYCLYLEEIAMEIHFKRYCIERAHFENKDEFLKLEVEGVNERRPSIGIGDQVYASDPFLKTERNTYQGIIYKIEQDCILAKFHSEFHHNHNRKDFRIDFFFSRTSFRRQQFALDQVLSTNGLGLNFLFPTVGMIKKKNPQLDVTLSENENMLLNGKEIEFFNKSLNIYQKNAVINVLRGEARPLPYIIYGPPGTGKTRTVVECIKQISRKITWSRIIVATPSNSAANLIVDNLIESGLYKGGDFIRFVSYNQIEKDLIPNHLKKYCATIDIGHDNGEDSNNSMNSDSRMMINASKSIIINYKVYISTLSTLGSLLNIKFPRDHFTHVIIDEAGQSVEPESLIPISLLSQDKGQVILAGDIKQLGPVLVSQVSKFCGFERSFLERLSEHENYLPIYGPNKAEFNPNFVTQLKKNYRSLPSILKIYSHLFYNNLLEAEISDKNSQEFSILKSINAIVWNKATANPKCGAFFVNVNGKNMKTIDSSSWYNNDEASRIFIFVCKLKKLGIPLKSVGIIAPYALQVKNLKRIINESMPDCEIKVGSVEEFQGQERDVILISTVRTNRNMIATDQKFGLGFIQCPKRINVAISRARAVLIVFGKESLLTQDDNWRYFIEYTKENGTYVSETIKASSDN